MTPSLFDDRSFYPAEFEQLWARYAYKRGKEDALTAWRKTAAIRPPNELLYACIDEYKSRIKKEKIAPKYLAGYLRDKRWNDDIDEAKHRLANPRPAERVLKPFRASDYEVPEVPEKYRPAAEIISEDKAKKALDNTV